MPVAMTTAAPSDFPAVLSFWRQATEMASSTDDLDGLTVLHAHDPDALVLAVDNGEIIGTLIAAWDGWRAGFYRLAVLPERRGEGVGRALVAEGEARVHRHGARRISLFAVEAHEGAVAFWRSIGYRPDPDDLRFVNDLLPPGEC
jgi:ribosomal protein S18 acetylase RimI-like enzyme